MQEPEGGADPAKDIFGEEILLVLKNINDALTGQKTIMETLSHDLQDRMQKLERKIDLALNLDIEPLKQMSTA